MPTSPALIGFLHTLFMVVVFTVLAFIGQATNLTFLSPQTAAIVAVLANFLAHALSPSGTTLFGSVKL